MPLSSAAGIASQKCRNAFFLEADVDEHRLQPHLDVLYPALVDTPDDVAGAVPLNVILFEPAILEKGDAPLQLLHADDELLARFA